MSRLSLGHLPLWNHQVPCYGSSGVLQCCSQDTSKWVSSLWQTRPTQKRRPHANVMDERCLTSYDDTRHTPTTSRSQAVYKYIDTLVTLRATDIGSFRSLPWQETTQVWRSNVGRILLRSSTYSNAWTHTTEGHVVEAYTHQKQIKTIHPVWEYDSRTAHTSRSIDGRFPECPTILKYKKIISTF